MSAEGSDKHWTNSVSDDKDEQFCARESVLNSGETPPNPLSKNQIKKQRKQKEFERIKKLKRLKERERQKQKRLAALKQGLPTHAGLSRKALKKRETAAGDIVNALNIAIDLDYDGLMSDKDVAKCVKQCLRIYTINRRCERPAKVHFTGIKTEGRIHTTLKKNDGWKNWKVNFHFDRSHCQIFPKEQIVYLTSESDNVLAELEPGKTYIIGGLVDHNHQKGLCHERATKAGLQTARLPLSEHVDMKTRAVLSTFHVFEILSRFAAGKTWTEAILLSVPLRKGAKPKQQQAHVNKSTDAFKTNITKLCTQDADKESTNGHDDNKDDNDNEKESIVKQHTPCTTSENDK